MRWLVTGARGMLGREVTARLARDADLGTSVTALDRASLDITDPDAVNVAVGLHRPDVVVNCAAFTAVDAAETREAEAALVNSEGPAYLAMACADCGARLIHISTDYVFGGESLAVSGGSARAPYFEDDPPCPGTVYGRTKFAGEQAVLDRLPGSATIVRTAWLYAAQGRNFVRTMVDIARRGETVDVVDDQAGCPTWAADVAERIVTLGRRPEAAGIFHAVNVGETTWCELAKAVFRLAGADPDRVRPTATRLRSGLAPRPACTVLGQRRWPEVGADALRHWRSALQAALTHFG